MCVGFFARSARRGPIIINKLTLTPVRADNANSQINPVYPYAWEQCHAEPQRSISVPSATDPSLRLRVTVEEPISSSIFFFETPLSASLAFTLPAYFVQPHTLPIRWDHPVQDSPKTSVTTDANVTLLTRKNDLSAPQK